MLLQVVLYAYAHGIVSSRGIARACREHVTFIALCGNTAPHFTTIAHFVSFLGRGYRARLCGGAGSVRSAGLDRARDVRDRWREAAEQRVETTKWQTRRFRETGRETRSRGFALAWAGLARTAQYAAQRGLPIPGRTPDSLIALGLNASADIGGWETLAQNLKQLKSGHVRHPHVEKDHIGPWGETRQRSVPLATTRTTVPSLARAPGSDSRMAGSSSTMRCAQRPGKDLADHGSNPVAPTY